MRFWPRARAPERPPASKSPPAFGQSAPDLSQSLDPFWQSVASTIEYCGTRADVERPREFLRGDDTRPRALESNYFSAVDRVSWPRQRRERAGPRQLSGGRLLLYFPDEETADGVAELETSGFFDVHDAPPWDTWVAMLEDAAPGARGPYLVAWIPPIFLVRAQAGIDVNAMECIAWLNDCDVALRELAAASQ